MTLRDLAAHTSRLLPWFPFYADGRDFWAILERALSESAPLDVPVYSDLNYMLLAQVFTSCSGLSLRDGLEKYIKTPLRISGMDYGPVDPISACPSCFGNQIEKGCVPRGTLHLPAGGPMERSFAAHATMGTLFTISAARAGTPVFLQPPTPCPDSGSPSFVPGTRSLWTL